MKPSALCLIAACSFTLARATPADDLVAATRKLADAPNFTWTVTVEIANTQFPVIPTEGVTEKDGYTVVTTNFNGNTRQFVRKGQQVVLEGPNGDWVTMEEMRQRAASGGQGGQGGRGGFGFGLFGRGAQMDLGRDAARLAEKVKDAKVVDGAIVATLRSEDAASLLTFGRGGRGGQGGQSAPAPKNATGSITAWLKDGALTKYAVNVKGTVTTPNGDERDVDITTTTEIRDVGTTKVTVPEAAKKKFAE